jgi:hypothetical protein
MLTLAATNRATGQPLELAIEEPALAAFLERLRAELLDTSRPMSRKQFARHVGKSLDFVKRRLREGMPRIQRRRRGPVLIPVGPAMQWLAGKEAA